jgi:hypothetical protein
LFLPIILFHAAASVAMMSPEAPVLTGDTSKSLSDFRQCFAAIEQQHARPISMVPYEDGGARISNEGAIGVTNPYRIRFTQGARVNHVQASIAQSGGAEAKTLVDGIKSCW